MVAPPRSDIDLKGRRVLVVEDEYFIADEIAGALVRFGAEVVGPVPDLDAARAMLDSEAVDCAVLDINLKGEMAFSLAAELLEKGVPIVFATGYDAPLIPPRFADIPRFEKPLKMDQLVKAVAAHCGRGLG